LPEIVRAFQAAGIRTRVLTNGVDLTAELIDRLLAAGLRDVSFSLNSLRPDLQENLDDAGHTFERRIANLLALAERLPKNRTLPLLNTVVTPHNLDELERLVEFAERIGFYLSFIPVHLARDGDADHPAYGSDNDLRFTQESEAQVRATYQRLIEHKRRGAPILNSTAFLRRSADYLLGANAAWPCRAGRFYVSVAPDGRIGACHAFEGMRDVRYDEFAGKYADPSWRREFIRAPENCEGCLRPCWAEVSFMLTDARSLWEMARLQTRAWWPRRRVDVAAVRDWLRRSPGVA
jgi:MoaA/NifB/PqqE/SkfB family radical SAM enzyme